MQCPKCQSHSLKPCHLTYGLPSLMCTKCNGHSVNLLSYRNWAELSQQDSAKKTNTRVSADNTSKALLCTKCSKIMLKYKFSNQNDNRVDICTTCDDVWLDNGEWALLVELDIHKKLTDIVTAPWQSKLRDEKSKQREFENCKNLLGQKSFERVNEFKEWFKDHPEKFYIFNYLKN